MTMNFIKAEQPVYNAKKARAVVSIRVFDNGNVQIMLPKIFTAQHMPNINPDGMFSVQWGTGPDEGKAMIACVASGTIKARDIRGCVSLLCRKPPHAPLNKRAAKDCKLLSVTNGAVLVQLPKWGE